MSATTGPDVQPADPTTTHLRSAEVWQRVAARLVDHVGLAIVTAILLTPLGLGASLLGGPAGYLAGAFSAAVSAALTVGYFSVLEARDGQTIGKRLLGVRVVDAAGRPPVLASALRRNAWTGLGVVSVVPVVGGLVGSAITLLAAIAILVGITRDQHGRGWHDTFAGGTRVVGGR